MEENIRPGLEQVIRLDPTNSTALVSLAKAILKDDASAEAKADASNLARLALRFDPSQADAREVPVRIGTDKSGAK
jgi:cytochrome c-type biogenesis protein CcmH/NrfG